MTPTRLIAGAMSGTSADGIDIALVRIEGTGLTMSPALILHHHRPYPDTLRRQIFSIRSTSTVSLADLADLARQISLNYAAAVNEALLAAHLSAADLACIAAHGQTLYHAPPNTIQWLDPALLAAEVGCPVISDFRRADCALAGQGAPLVPFTDYLLFRHPTRTRVLINLGGIANLTYLPAQRPTPSPHSPPTPGSERSEDPDLPPTQNPLDHVIAFDTGPANCISDHLMRRFAPHLPPYDANGRLASTGTPIDSALTRFLAHPYFSQRPPKSTDTPTMIALFLSSFEQEPSGATVSSPARSPDDALSSNSLPNLLATAARATAQSLLDALSRFLPTPPDELILSGGGIHNQAILSHLRAQLPSTPLLTTDDLGIKSDAKEALAFALLAAATLDNFPSNVPSVTGALRPAILGSLTPKP